MGTERYPDRGAAFSSHLCAPTMPRPTSKKDLVAQSRSNFDALNAFIGGLFPADRERSFKPGTMNRNIRDVLGHMHHWHALMLGWYAVGMKGDKPEMPAKGHTWATTPELNRWIHATYSDVPMQKYIPFSSAPTPR
jgi:hypothetical protein